MKIKQLISLVLPLLLTGCIGSWISGKTGYLKEEYPDIRSVPERAEATCSRGLHEGKEETCRQGDFKSLEQEREKIKARDQAIREKAFPNQPYPPEPNFKKEK